MYLGPFGVPTEEDQRLGIFSIAISDFRVAPARLKYVMHLYAGALSSDNCMVSFLKSDTAAGLTRS